MQMIARRRHRLVDVRVRMHAAILPPLIVGSWNQMPEMLNHACGEKALTVGVEVESPWIDRAVCHNLEDVSRGMVAPDTASQIDTSLRRVPRSSHSRWLFDSVSHVKPAVRSPREAVHTVVLSLQRPAFQMHRRVPVRHVIVVVIRNERQVRRRCDPDSAEANLKPGQVSQSVAEHSAAVEDAVAICVLEDEDEIAGFVGKRTAVV